MADSRSARLLTRAATGTHYLPASPSTGMDVANLGLPSSRGVHAKDTLALLRAVHTVTLTTGDTAFVAADHTDWYYDPATGAGKADDGVNVLKPDDVLLSSNGRWYPRADQLGVSRLPIATEINANTGTTTLDTIAIAAATDVQVYCEWDCYTTSTERTKGGMVATFYRSGSGAAAELSNVVVAPWSETDATWAPTIQLSGNNVLLKLTSDTVYKINVRLRTWVKITDTSGATDPLAAAEAVVAAIGPAMDLRSDIGVHDDTGAPGTCDLWTSQVGDITAAQGTDANNVPISTLADGTTPALVWNGAQGLDLAGTFSANTSHTCFVVLEPTGGAGVERYVWHNQGFYIFGQLASGGTNPGIVVDGAVWQVATSAQTTDLQALEYEADLVGMTAKIFRDGVSILDGTYTVARAITGGRIGAHGAVIAIGNMRARVARILYFDKVLSAPQKASVYALLRLKYSDLP